MTGSPPRVCRDHDPAEALAQVGDVGGEREDRHDLGRRGDDELVLARDPVDLAAEPHDRVAELAVVHVERPGPRDRRRVDVQRVPVVQRRVERGGEQVVGGRHGVEVAVQVEVDLLHRHDLRVAAAGAAALDAEDWSHRGLAETEHRALADLPEPLGERDRGGGLALAGLRRRDGSGDDELAVGPLREALEDRKGHLGSIPPVRLQLLVGDPRLGGDLRDGAQDGLLRDLESALHPAQASGPVARARIPGGRRGRAAWTRRASGRILEWWPSPNRSARTSTPARVVVVRDGVRSERTDSLATEEPLEIRVQGPGQEQAQVAVTMRTPGGDFELAVGFLFTEGLIAPGEVRRVAYCDNLPGEDQRYNVVSVTLDRPFDSERLRRNFFANSSCGVCGKATLEDIEIRCAPVAPGPEVAARGPALAAGAAARRSEGVRANGGTARGGPVRDRRGRRLGARGRRPAQRRGQGDRRALPGGRPAARRARCFR